MFGEPFRSITVPLLFRNAALRLATAAVSGFDPLLSSRNTQSTITLLSKKLGSVTSSPPLVYH